MVGNELCGSVKDRHAKDRNGVCLSLQIIHRAESVGESLSARLLFHCLDMTGGCLQKKREAFTIFA